MRWPFTRRAAVVPATAEELIQASIDCGIAAARKRRIAREGQRQQRRFDHARPKVEQLRYEIAMRMVDL